MLGTGGREEGRCARCDSGDGRIALTAAKSRGCKAVGIEIDQELVQTSADASPKSEALDFTVMFEHAYLFEADSPMPTFVAVEILPVMPEKLKPKFA